MEANETIINTFATRVRQLILHCRDLRQENAGLKTAIEERDKVVEQQKAEIEKLRHDYDTLKMAKMLQLTDGDIAGARKRLNRLIRQVDKCLSLLSSKD